jgi:hypothetical protein
VNRLQIIAVVGFVALEACSAADDAAERPVDAGHDVKSTARPDVQGADGLDASGGSYADETSTPPDPDVDTPDTTLPPPDGTSPPPNDAPPLDRTTPPPNDAPPPPPLDATMDSTTPSCVVTFTVNGVGWEAPEGGTDAQTGTRVVRLVGDAANIGSWTPTAGVLLAEMAPGTWWGTATFRDQQLTEFKFVKIDGITAEWETWTPFDSNRSLRVECSGDAGTLRDAADATGNDAFNIGDGPADRALDGDAPSDVASDIASSDGMSDAAGSADAGVVDANPDAQDGGAADALIVPVPARGKSYAGVFGVRPLDATK